MTIRLSQRQRDFFGKGRCIYSAEAPGRMDVMGGIADYSGSLVLQMPIRETTLCRLALRKDGVFRVYSESADAAGLPALVQSSIQALSGKKRRWRPEQIRQRLKQVPGGDWAAYVIGCFYILAQAGHLPLVGADVWIRSAVPIGKGVSSSAALEVAVLSALASTGRWKPQATELPILAQRVENTVVGAPCGLMDQLASYNSKARHLLPILCQPDILDVPIQIPRTLQFVGIDSGVQHAVSDASYGDVRTAAYMGYGIIARHLGMQQKIAVRAKAKGRSKQLPYGGYLANIRPAEFESRFKDRLPERMRGRTFLKKYGTTIDPITTPLASKSYAVRVAAAHPVYENHRVTLFQQLLQTVLQTRPGLRQRQALLASLGELMYQSHASYSACGLGNNVTDAIVEAVRRSGPERGLYGAKITGGGCGGTVCILCEGKGGFQAAQKIARAMGRHYKRSLYFFEGSGKGARERNLNAIHT